MTRAGVNNIVSWVVYRIAKGVVFAKLHIIILKAGVP
jgi:hypothetical protein